MQRSAEYSTVQNNVKSKLWCSSEYSAVQNKVQRREQYSA